MASKATRPFTPVWRWLIGLSSIGAFVGGWAVLAHAPNPYETASASAPAVAAPTVLPKTNTNSPQNSQQTSPIVPLETAPTVPTVQMQQTAPQVQPTTTPIQSQRSTTRTGRQPKVRTGGS